MMMMMMMVMMMVMVVVVMMMIMMMVVIVVLVMVVVWRCWAGQDGVRAESRASETGRRTSSYSGWTGVDPGQTGRTEWRPATYQSTGVSACEHYITGIHDHSSLIHSFFSLLNNFAKFRRGHPLLCCVEYVVSIIWISWLSTTRDLLTITKFLVNINVLKKLLFYHTLAR